MRTLAELRSRFAGPGQVKWIGVRPSRGAPMNALDHVVIAADGLEGDRYQGRDGARAVTLVQAEHLPVIATLAGVEAVAPATLRRNLVVAGVNLIALKGTPFKVGSAVLEITGPCAPCSKMEDALGRGGYNAMRGHGGWCARVMTPGEAAVGDSVYPA